MPIPKITGELYSENNYSAFTGDNYNITVLNAKAQLGQKTSVSLGFGNVWTVEEGKSSNVPAMEGIVNQDIGEHLSGYARLRKYGKTDEYRIGFQAGCNISKNQSIYAGTHYTMSNYGEWSRNTGYWIGYTYEFKNGTTISTELEQGIPLKETARSIGHTIGSFNDSNKTFNVVISVPIN
jgi:hypothetical protein